MDTNEFIFLIVSPKVKLPAPVLQVLPGYKLSCLATGSPPIYKALLRNSTVLVNTTYAAYTILNEEGNYTCVATNKYGTDVGEVSVIFKGKNSILLLVRNCISKYFK